MKRKEEILTKIKESVQMIEPESEIILFGSRARGDEKEDQADAGSQWISKHVREG